MRPVTIIAIAGMTLLTVAPAIAADGQAIFRANCAPCHNAMKPKLGDKANWVSSVITGKGNMPPRGGKPSLSDSDIEAAVEYLKSTAH